MDYIMGWVIRREPNSYQLLPTTYYLLAIPDYILPTYYHRESRPHTTACHNVDFNIMPCFTSLSFIQGQHRIGQDFCDA